MCIKKHNNQARIHNNQIQRLYFCYLSQQRTKTGHKFETDRILQQGCLLINHIPTAVILRSKLSPASFVFDQRLTDLNDAVQ
jgi:hypothetical protein